MESIPTPARARLEPFSTGRVLYGFRSSCSIPATSFETASEVSETANAGYRGFDLRAERECVLPELSTSNWKVFAEHTARPLIDLG